jgi:hypothetical protein
MPDADALRGEPYTRLLGRVPGSVAILRLDRPLPGPTMLTAIFSAPEARAFAELGVQMDVIDHELVVLHGVHPSLPLEMRQKMGAPRTLRDAVIEYPPAQGEYVVDWFVLAFHLTRTGDWLFATANVADHVRAELAAGAPAPLLPVADDVSDVLFVGHLKPPGWVMRVTKINGDELGWFHTRSDAEASEVEQGLRTRGAGWDDIRRKGWEVFSRKRARKEP